MVKASALATSVASSRGESKRPSSISDSIFAGAYAGMVARLISAPLDLLKIRFQLQGILTNESGHMKYRNVWQATKTIVKEEGITALWKGNVAATYLWVSYSMVQFGIYGLLKDIAESFEAKMLSQNYDKQKGPFDDTHIALSAGTRVTGRKDTKISPQVTQEGSGNQYLHALMLFLCGAGAAIVATSATYPFDIMRTQFTIQGNTKVYSTMLSYVGGTLQKQGLAGFYAGITPTLVGITPYIGLNFAFYDVAKKWTDDKARGVSSDHSQLASVLKRGFSGAIAGGASKLIVYPLDTVKRRMQASVLQSTLGEGGVGTVLKYRGIMDCLSLTIKGEGISGLYKGVGPTLLKSCVSTAITFVAYEQGLQIAKSLRSKEKGE